MTEPSSATLIEVLAGLRDHEASGFSFLGADGEIAARLAYAEVVRRAESEARKLRARGVGPGDRVAIVAPEPDVFIHLFLGALLAGAIAVPIAPPQAFDRPEVYAEGVRAIFGVAEPRVAVVSDRLVPAVHAHAPELVAIAAYSTLVDDGAPLPARRPRPDEPAFLQFTSGSTARPRGVCVTHGNLAINAAAIARSVGAGPHDVGVNWLPLFHDMGLFGSVIVPLVCRMPVVHMPTAAFAAQPRRWMEAMSRHGGTYAFAPNFAYALAARRTPEPARLALSQVRMLGCAAEPISAATLRAFEAHFAPAGLRQGSIVPCYGMAEATVAISFCAPGAPLRVDALEAEHYRVERRAQRRGAGEAAAGGVVEVVACGAVIEGHALRVVDDDLQPLPDRHVGEIVFEGPSVTAGYWREPERTAEVYVAPQTIRTGDLGYLADGQIYVTGRRKDLLIVRGRNVDPQDVERIATEQPGVRAGNAVAFSIPSDETELVVVIAETKEAPTPELAAAIQRAVHQALALPVADVQLVAAGAIHKTSSGKLQRARMRAEYLARRAAAPPQDDGGGSP